MVSSSCQVYSMHVCVCMYVCILCIVNIMCYIVYLANKVIIIIIINLHMNIRTNLLPMGHT